MEHYGSSGSGQPNNDVSPSSSSSSFGAGGGGMGSPPYSIEAKLAQLQAANGANGFKLIPNRIFVGGMSRETSEADLHRFFADYGNVKNAKIITDGVGQSKGYGFVTFGSEEEARRVQGMANNAMLHNRKLNVGPAIKRNLVANGNGNGHGGGGGALAENKPDGGRANDSHYSGYSSSASSALLPNIDPMLYQPTMLPCYGFPMNFPYMYPSQNFQNYPY